MIMNETIIISHGSGGKQTHDLIHSIFFPAFNNPELNREGDAAILDISGVKLAFTTDSFVVKPIFFPGGDIGKLAVAGTVNDLAVSGAKPLYLSCGFILHEGFSIEKLKKITLSMKQFADECGVRIVTGDTKVVERNSNDELFINSAGIGLIHKNAPRGKEFFQEGDAVIVTGTVGDHGAAIFSVRENMGFDTEILSDCASVYPLAEIALEHSENIRIMRDPTRGGVAAVLNEFIENTPFGIEIVERVIPVRNDVKTICEILGFDPLHLACEGRMVIVLSQAEAVSLVEKFRKTELGKGSAIIGSIRAGSKGLVSMKTIAGGERVVDSPSGELLPRIC